MTTSDVRLPTTAFERSAVAPGTTLAALSSNVFHCPFDSTFPNSSTDPNLYSLNNPHAFSTNTSSAVSTPTRDCPPSSSTCIYLHPRSSGPTPNDERPCEKYRQFLDSSRQERTFMIEKLVETSAEIIDSIWNPRFLADQQKVKVISTRGFIHEILKRSKTTYSTLQISLFYLFRVKKIVHEKLRLRLSQSQKQQPTPVSERLDDLMCCGRRMFLASLMVSCKYLHDKNYRNRAWAKISGLSISEINASEMAFLKLIDYKLFVSKPTFDKWYTLLHGYIQKHYKVDNTPPTPGMATYPSPPPMEMDPLPSRTLPSPFSSSGSEPSTPSSSPYRKGAEHIDASVTFNSGDYLLSPPSSQPQQDDFAMGMKRPWVDPETEYLTLNSKRVRQ
ncbi:hypothetical protein DFQ28_002229 [Apophysomyces sp. BC1034]|nr:hypothetical protein DFQ30_003655 [Apophysomyces sp. BC1015]KAG0179785.1 hypothetical protein DFQ29_001666 [Apophysomyces sp. BC1021]KAG0190309.1 hypothetical protein DFQ28_002229 [Apophysomyces sp. BC1034]